MGWTAWGLPVFWAQATGGSVSNPNSLVPLSLRRWFGSLTLSSPESVPSLFGLWAWLGGLSGLLVLAICFQGPGKTLGQVFDVAGLARLGARATWRLRRAGRLLAATIGLTVLSWTGSQSLTYNQEAGRDDLIMLTKARAVGELGFEQGVLAALTPLRDVAGLGTNVLMLMIAGMMLFRAWTDAWGGALPAPGYPRRKALSGWAAAGWVSCAFLVLYRLISLGYSSTDLPLGGFVMVEAVVIPALMALCDGLLLGWVLVELRKAGLERAEDDALELEEVVELMPGGVAACLATLPARYLMTAVLLGSEYLSTSARSTGVGSGMRWVLSGGMIDIQALALLGAGLAGGVAWSGGSVSGAVGGYMRMLRAEGGRLVGVLALAGLGAGAASGIAYVFILSLPTATWVLTAADSYAHYATLPIGLWTLSAFVEMGERSLPVRLEGVGTGGDRVGLTGVD